MKVFVKGELRASHSQMLAAPPIGGGALQLTYLAHTGAVVKKGDLVMEFDPSEQRYKLEQSRSELLQADQEIIKAKADAAVVASQDKVALLKARFDVRRAQLDVQKNELVSAIDARKNQLALEGAQRVLAEVEQDVKSRSASNQATIELAQEKRNKAKLAMDQAEDNIRKMRVTSPMDGLVSLEKNEGEFYFTGMALLEYRAGDQVQPGRNVGQVIDPKEMELSAQSSEMERNNIKEGQTVDFQLDALPGNTFHGMVKTVGSSNSKPFWDAGSANKFEVLIRLTSTDARMRPGLTAGVYINSDPRKNVLYVPRQALFLKDNKRVVYVRSGESNFNPHEVSIEAENESRAAVEGLQRRHRDCAGGSHLIAQSCKCRSGVACRRDSIMASASTASTPRVLERYQRWLPDLRLGLQNLLLHRLRSMLTMLGMIFGVAAVVSMLSIGAGARQKVMALIEQMGVHNLIVEAKETTEWQAHQKIRKLSPGLTLQDYRVIRDDLSDVVAGTPRKRMTPTTTLPKSQQDPPAVFGVDPVYMKIAGLHMLEGRFFSDDEDMHAAPVCVLGAAARSSIFGSADPIGQNVKANEVWFRVIGVAAPQLSSQTEVAGVPTQDLNNIMYVPLNSSILRLEDNYSDVRDEIDGMYLNVRESADLGAVAQVVRAILDSSHHSAGDFSVIVPAELLAEQQRTERLFNAVMVAIASISLLVGGIGIMNIMLASILERTREIGVRRAVGARQADIIRQFVVEAVLISFVGGSFGIVFGFIMSRLIAWLAGWSTIVTASSILLAFVVSITVGLVFGIYPAVKAARLDPVEAIRYE